jgi:type I restriction enzyme S subunit
MFPQERERELFDSLKQSEIANIVTKGLNPNVKMKDSGIPWIGEIPEHWEVRTLSQMSRDHFISNKNVHHQNLLSLSYGKIVNKDINTTEGLLPASFDSYQIVEDGNIVLRLTDLQNDHKSLRVGLSTQEGIITSAYLALETFNDIIPLYLYYLLHTIDVKKVFYSMGNGLRQSLNWTELRKLKCVVPPLSEQQAIVAYIDEKLQKIDQYMTDLQREIDYLKEFKQRLISDAVTGQLCITNQ